MSIVPYEKGGKRAYRAKIKFQNKQYTKSGFTTKAEAKVWMVQEKKRLQTESEIQPIEQQNILMYSLACEQYLQDCAARMQHGTISEKLHHYRTFVKWIGQNFVLDTITVLIAQNYALHLLKTIHPPNDPNKTTNRHIKNLKALWNWHRKRGFQGINPFTSVIPYPEDINIRYIPPVEDVEAVLQVAEEWQKDFLHVLAKTGARPGEIRSLRWEDIDLNRETITLWTRKRKGGAKQPRILNMSPQLTEVMRRRFGEKANSKYVFTNPFTGKPLGRLDRPYRYMMERLCKKAKVKFFTFYALRHFVATRLRDSGKANRYEIQHILGHIRSDTTDRYLRGLAPDIKEAISVLDDVVNMTKITEKEEKYKAKVLQFKRR